MRAIKINNQTLKTSNIAGNSYKHTRTHTCAHTLVGVCVNTQRATGVTFVVALAMFSLFISVVVNFCAASAAANSILASRKNSHLF